jgi:MFS family permease
MPGDDQAPDSMFSYVSIQRVEFAGHLAQDPAYGTGTLHMPRNFPLQALLTATAISVFMTPFAGHLSDRFGRKPIYICSAPC